MTHNDILRRLRYALKLNNADLMEIFRQGELEVKPALLNGYLRKEDEEGFLPLEDEQMNRFLDGLISFKRGKRPGASTPRVKERLDNNLVLKKLRIALELKEEDLQEVMKQAGFPVSRGELSALFRSKGQHNYKECGDQLFRNFMKGLTLRYRGEP